MELNNKDKRRILAFLYRVLIVVFVVTPIVWMLPREKKFNYSFELGNPWRHGLLTAEYDFPIYKEKNRLMHEQDSVLKLFRPYYILDENIATTSIREFGDSCRKVYNSIFPSSSYKSFLSARLQDVYEQGILTVSEYDRLRSDSISSIYIIRGNVATEKKLRDVLTEKRAYSDIVLSDARGYSSNVMRRCNLNKFIVPNLVYDSVRSNLAREELLMRISAATGSVMKGQKIIDRGEIVNTETYNILKSLELESIKRRDTNSKMDVMVLGQVVYVLVLILCFFMYLDIFKPMYLRRRRHALLIFGLLVLSSMITSFFVKNYSAEYVYALPYTIVPIVIGIFFDTRTAVIINMVNTLICSMSLSSPSMFIALQFVGGLVGVYSLRELSQRSQLFKTAFLVFVAYSVTYLAIELISEASFDKVNYHRYIYFTANSVILLFTYPLLFLLEKIFGFTSNVTLVELSNINNKILREMSEIAPGTFQHSMQMANLAAAAAMKIGANAQLVRTGALYHDIGKMKNPAFFTENQTGVNPHEHLSYEESAQIVINHVYDGLKLADKYNLPDSVRRFIFTHHGCGKTKYFYISYKNEHPDEKIDESVFTYPGPNPGTKEEAILMMADSVEAASRSLKEYTEQTIGELVDKIVDSQLNEGYFKKCPITFLDIDDVKSVFKEKLRIMYHTRISYPELKTQQRQEPNKVIRRRNRFFK